MVEGGWWWVFQVVNSFPGGMLLWWNASWVYCLHGCVHVLVVKVVRVVSVLLMLYDLLYLPERLLVEGTVRTAGLVFFTDIVTGVRVGGVLTWLYLRRRVAVELSYVYYLKFGFVIQLRFVLLSVVAFANEEQNIDEFF